MNCRAGQSTLLQINRLNLVIQNIEAFERNTKLASCFLRNFSGGQSFHFAAGVVGHVLRAKRREEFRKVCAYSKQDWAVVTVTGWRIAVRVRDVRRERMLAIPVFEQLRDIPRSGDRTLGVQQCNGSANILNFVRLHVETV